MAKALFKQINHTLAGLLNDIELGEIGLPEIQRPFVWPNTKVRDLFDSMYQGFPVGYLLFWSNGASGEHRVIGTDIKQKFPHQLVVDGQQRLTSLYAVIKGIEIVRGDHRKERIIIAFRPRDGRFEVSDAANLKDPEFIPDISVLWSPTTSTYKLISKFLDSLNTAHPLNDDESRKIADAIDALFHLNDYQFTSLELSSTVNEEQVAEIFQRINSGGTTLNQADFILTLMSVFWNDGRSALEAFCRNAKTPSAGAASAFNHFLQPAPSELLRVSVGVGFRRARLRHVYSLLRGKDLDTELFSEEMRDKQFVMLKTAQARVLDIQNWKEFLKVLLRAGYRAGDAITSKAAILYTYVLWLIGKYDYGVDHDLLGEVMAQWFFMAALTGRYTSSQETQMEQDLTRLRDVKDKDAAGFVALWRKIIQTTLTADFWNVTLPGELAVSSARTPALYAYYAALNLLDARVLFSKIKVADLLDPAMHGKKTSLERHHLFPRKYLEKLGIHDRQQQNQLANFALVEWTDNIEISDTAPSRYLPKYLARFQPQDGDESELTEVSRMYYWHALPAGWEQLSYAAFLEARRKRMAIVIQDGFTLLMTRKVPTPQLEDVQIPDTVASDDEDAVPPLDTAKSRADLRLAFWTQLLQRAAEQTSLHAKRAPIMHGWLGAPAGCPGLSYYYGLRKAGTGINLTIYRSTVVENNAILDHLALYREEIEECFGHPLIWDRAKEGQRGAFICCHFSNGGLLDEHHWPEIQDSMIAAMIRLENALRPLIQELDDHKTVLSVPSKQWDEVTFFADMAQNRGETATRVARQIVDWVKQKGLGLRWGKGAHVGSFYAVLSCRDIDYNPFGIRSAKQAYVEVPFGSYQRTPGPTDKSPLLDAAGREALRQRLNRIPGVNIATSSINGWPTIPLSLLAEESSLASFFDAFEWLVGQA
jgi:hypothetical protein